MLLVMVAMVAGVKVIVTGTTACSPTLSGASRGRVCLAQVGSWWWCYVVLCGGYSHGEGGGDGDG